MPASDASSSRTRNAEIIFRLDQCSERLLPYVIRLSCRRGGVARAAFAVALVTSLRRFCYAAPYAGSKVNAMLRGDDVHHARVAASLDRLGLHEKIGPTVYSLTRHSNPWPTEHKFDLS